MFTFMTDDEYLLMEQALDELEEALADGDAERSSDAFERARALGALDSDIDEILERYPSPGLAEGHG